MGTAISARAQTNNGQTGASVPDGTTFIAAARHSVKTEKAKVGDMVEFQTLMPTLIAGRIVVPRLAVLHGRVVEAQAGDPSGTDARLAVLIDSITWKHYTVPACASMVGIAVVQDSSGSARFAPLVASSDPRLPGMGMTDQERLRARMDDPRQVQDPAQFIAGFFNTDGMPSGYQFPKEVRIERYAARPSVLIRPKKNLELPGGQALAIRQLQGGGNCRAKE